MSVERPLISERNARDLSPEVRAMYHVIPDRPPSVEGLMQQFYREGRPGEVFGEYLMRTADRREAEFQARRCADYAKDNARLRALIESTQDRNGLFTGKTVVR